MSSCAAIIDEDQLGGLAEAAGVDGVRAILDAFWTSTAELAQALIGALSEEDPEEIIKCGHALKGSSANVGAALMSERAREIEDAAKAGDMAAAREALALFANDIAATRSAVEALLSRYG
jgi:HPt (histidine-containing phosphotransfer) domain-containing protein